MPIIDAHLHLNGSISLEYLEATAHRNGCLEAYNQLILENDPWKKFGFVHQIIQTTNDITEAVVDVVKYSSADVLEIRTTPKPINGQSTEAYIQAFVEGLQRAMDLYPNKKARGLLSIDRTRHTLEEAKWLIDRSLAEKQSSGMIVGIDLSGNYLTERKLTGNDLFEAIQYALNKDIGLALHVGEIDSEIEKSDFDLILRATEEYSGKIYGKVRLGHAIYRTQAQDEIIRRYKIPVEICPSCHQQLAWWQQDKPHPILSLYQYRSQVLPGTDDSLIFNCDARQEQETLDGVLAVSDKLAGLSQEEQAEVTNNKRQRYLF